MYNAEVSPFIPNMKVGKDFYCGLFQQSFASLSGQKNRWQMTIDTYLWKAGCQRSAFGG